LEGKGNEMKPVDCGKCLKREACKELCAEAERYVNQDYVKHDELYIPTGVADTMPEGNWFESIASNFPLTKRERQIVRLFGLGLNRKDICYVLEISANALEKVISRLKAKAREMSAL
jgi:DNA-binding NarL/FixJ family response regulator